MKTPVRAIAPVTLAVYGVLARIRPISWGERIKLVLGIERIPFQLPDGRVYAVDPVSYQGLSLLRHGKYEPLIEEIIQLVLRPGDAFFDIGANEGYFSIQAASIVGKDGLVIAVEPQSRLHAVLEKNITLNDFSSIVQVVPAALMETPGEMEIFLTPTVNSGASSLKKAYRHSKKSEAVRVSTFEQIFVDSGLERLRLAKVDCEGAEPEIIGGAGRILTERLADFLIIEYHPSFCGDEAVQQTHERVLAAGYEWVELGPLHRLYAVGHEKTVAAVRDIVSRQGDR